jgi:hypothetical protein
MRQLPLRMFSSGTLMRVLFATATAFPADILLLGEWLSVAQARLRGASGARDSQRPPIRVSGNFRQTSGISSRVIARRCLETAPLQHS